MEIFKKQAKAGKCVIIVTHSENVCKYADYIYELKRNDFSFLFSMCLKF